jgi:thiol:disulfide interchange protein DsbA
MLNSFLRLLLTLLVCALSLAVVRAADSVATPPPFQEGKDYVRLSTPVPTSVPDKPEVVELFSYRCPHCYRSGSVGAEWLKRKPDNVAFVRIPVSAGYQADYESAARAYYAAEALGCWTRFISRCSRPSTAISAS